MRTLANKSGATCKVLETLPQSSGWVIFHILSTIIHSPFENDYSNNQKANKNRFCLCCSTTPPARYTILLRACRRVADSQRARLWLSRMEEVRHTDHTVLGIIYIQYHRPNYKIQSYSKYDWRGVKFFILTILSGLHPGNQVKLAGGDGSRIAGSQCFAGSTGSWSRLCCCRTIVKGHGKMPGGRTFFGKWHACWGLNTIFIYLMYVFLVTQLASLCFHPTEMMVEIRLVGTDKWFDTSWKVEVTKISHWK